MKRAPRCSTCRGVGHYSRTCKSQSPVTPRAGYSAASNRVFVNALREWLGLKPIRGGE